MSSRIREIGDAIVSALNNSGSTFSQSFDASFIFEANYTIPDGESLKVVVIPHSNSKERDARRRWAWIYEFHVGILANVSKSNSTGIDEEAVDALLSLLEEFHPVLQDGQFGETAKAKCSAPIVNDPPYDPVDLEERKFVSVLELTLRSEQ